MILLLLSYPFVHKQQFMATTASFILLIERIHVRDLQYMLTLSLLAASLGTGDEPAKVLFQLLYGFLYYKLYRMNRSL